MTIDEALALLQQQGFKLTERRKVIIQFFIDKDRYCTAKELNDFLEPLYKGISFDTVYRNLHLFTDLGILETTELDGEKLFQIACVDHHHHHFICRDCGKTKEIYYCPMETIKGSLDSYLVEDHKFEVYGLCPTCQSA